MPKPSKQYVLFFKIAAGVVPVIMAAAGFFYGDITPVVRDICGTLLPEGTVVTRPSVTTVEDAGAPR